MFTDEELDIIYSALKDTVFLNTMDEQVNIKLMRDQNNAYEIMRAKLYPSHARATEPIGFD